MEQNKVFPDVRSFIRKLKEDNTFENQWNSLIDYDIIDKTDKIREQSEQILNDFKIFEQLDNKQKICICCFLGLTVGDSMGNLTDGFELDYERNIIKNFESINKDLRLPIGMISDDTSLALCLSDTLIMNNYIYNAQDFRLRILLWWYEAYNNGKNGYFMENSKIDQNLPELKKNVKQNWSQSSFGIGNTVWESGLNFARNCNMPYTSEQYGDQDANGSMMRLAPIPIFFRDNLDLGMKIAEEQSRATHNGQLAAECCKLMTYIIIKIINLENNQLLQQINEQNKSQKILNCIFNEINNEQILDKYELESDEIKCLIQSKKNEKFQKNQYNQVQNDQDWDWKNKDFKYSITRSSFNKGAGIGAFSMDCLCMALHLIYYSKNYEDCILKVVNLGGDADTLGSVTGQIAGAIWGNDVETQQYLLNQYKNYIVKWDQQKVLIRSLTLINNNNFKNNNN